MITASLSACDCLSHLRVSSPGLIHAYCIARTVSGCGFPHMFEEKDNARELQEYALPCQHLSPEIRFLRNLAWKYACRGMGCRNVEWFFFCTCNLCAQEVIQAGLPGGTIQLLEWASKEESPQLWLRLPYTQSLTVALQSFWWREFQISDFGWTIDQGEEVKDVQYDGEDHDDNFDALKRHMQQLSEDYARVVEEPSRGKRIEALCENAA